MVYLRSSSVQGIDGGIGGRFSGGGIGNGGNGDGWLGPLGPNPGRVLKSLWLFYEIGKEFNAGADSLRKVATSLVTRSLTEELPNELPATLTSVQRATVKVEDFFNGHPELAGKSLFIRQGQGRAIVGLTAAGLTAWELTRSILRRLGVIGEND